MIRSHGSHPFRPFPFNRRTPVAREHRLQTDGVAILPAVRIAQQQSRARKAVLGALYGLVAGTAAAALLTSPAMSVRSVRVSGTDGLRPAEIAAVTKAAGVRRGANWLRAPIGAIRRRLKLVPCVADARVSRGWLLAVNVTLRVRRPCVVAAGTSGMFEVDSACVPIRHVDSRTPSTLPTVTFSQPPACSIGCRCTDPGLSAATAVARRLRATFPEQVDKMAIDHNLDLCLNMHDGLVVRFGSRDQASAKAALLRRVYLHSPDVATQFAEIDVTSPEWPACVLRGKAQVQAAGPGSADVAGAVGAGQGAGSKSVPAGGWTNGETGRGH